MSIISYNTTNQTFSFHRADLRYYMKEKMVGAMKRNFIVVLWLIVCKKRRQTNLYFVLAGIPDVSVTFVW